PGSPLDEPLSLATKIRLPHNKNTLSFELTAPNYQSTGHLNFAHMLEGFDNDWIANGSDRTILYTQLPPGKYKLKLKAANRDGIWGDPVTGMAVQIMRPWWTSFIAYCFYFFIILIIVWVIIRVQLRRQRMEMSIKLNRVEANKYKELDALKSRFFANISHEFRTPLTLIMNPVDELLAQAQSETFINPLKMVQRNARKLQSYINDILELTKLEAGRLEINRKRFDIMAYTKFLAAPFESLAMHRNIALQISSSNAQIICYLDPEKYNTIFTNLLSNAIKYTPNGGRIDIELSVCGFGKHQQCRLDKGCTLLSMRNSGIGIPVDKIPYVFDRYYQVMPDKSRKDAGTGLGLALVSELVNLHHGDIKVKSREHEFTEFIARFPQNTNCPESTESLQPLDFDAGEDFVFQAIAKNKDQIDNQSDGREDDKKIVLIIEDNTDMRTILNKGLKKEYQVYEASDGEEGETKAIELIPDLIISDLMMPKKDGYEVTTNLKLNELTSHIPVILLTARADMKGKLDGLQTGADDYLVKPFNSKELKIRIANLLEQRDKLKAKYSQQNKMALKSLQFKSIDEAFLEKTYEFIEQHLSDEQLNVQMVYTEMGMSRTQLHRKLKALIGKSANDLIRSIRLEKAATMIKNKTANISEISFMVGFTSPQYFTRAFKEHFGCTPSEYMNKQS
nr:response regulator [Bacteroidota bacterium]